MNWNGTATNRRTINGSFRRYYRQFALVGILLGLVVTLALHIYSREFGRLMDAIYYMQDFFEAMEETQNRMREFISLDGEESRQKIRESGERAQQDLACLEEVNIGGNYRRNIGDVRRMLTDYLAVWEQVEAGSVSKVDGLKKMETLQDAIARRQEVFEEELHGYCNRRRNEMHTRMRVLAALLAATLVFALLLIWHNTQELTKQIVHPVQKLSLQAQKIRTDDLEHVPPILLEGMEVPEEIETLREALSLLLQRIGDQVVQLKETMHIREELKERELENLRVQHQLTSSELKCLQMQMNPHFIFNTLSMIQQTLYLDQKEKTSHLLKETASFLRYSLDYVGKNVTLERELEGLGCYVNLQEERLGERIFFEFVLDERLSGWIVPCLILQPLVENSIIHGMTEKLSGAEITIRTRYDETEKCGRISIEDNGQGMSEEKLKKLRENLYGDSQKAQERIGLHNVARRLELFEGGQGWLEIDSEEGRGTVVTVVLKEQQ